MLYSRRILFLCMVLQTCAVNIALTLTPSESPDDRNEITEDSTTSDATIAEGSLRLVNTRNSATNEGRLEIYHNFVWGTVCDDFGELSVDVACRQLGYLSGTVLPQYTHGEGVDPIWLDEVVCSGSELTLSDCRHFPWGRTDCDHDEDVALQCVYSATDQQPEFTTQDRETAETILLECGVIDDYVVSTDTPWTTEDQQVFVDSGDTSTDELVPDPKSTTEEPIDNPSASEERNLIPASEEPNHKPTSEQPNPNPLIDVPATEPTTRGTNKCLEAEFTDITGALRLGLFKKLGLSFVLTIGVSNKINICLMERFDKLKAELGVSCTITELPNKKLKLKATVELTAKIKSTYKYIGPRPSDGAPQYRDNAGYVYTLVGDCWETD